MHKDKREIGLRIYEAAHLTGSFVLRSGQTSTQYFDKYRFEARPELLWEIGEQMLPLIPEGTQVLAGLEMGGIPVATALSLRSGLPAAFVRKQAKEYGTRKLAEGVAIAEQRVCIVEDVVTTGGQILKSVRELRALGAQVDTVLCVLLRGAESVKLLAGEGLTLKAAFTLEEIQP